jgi:hypothetical protein
MSTGELLTRWTIRGALTLYVLGLALRMGAAGRPVWLRWARRAWAAGCFAFLLRMFCAFAFFHAWSHQAAYEATARQTAEVVGLAWGGGLYANYAFAVVWCADAFWWVGWPQRYLARPRAVEWMVQGFLPFIAFNATVVFGAGAVRWMGLAAALLLVALVSYTNRPSRWLP